MNSLKFVLLQFRLSITMNIYKIQWKLDQSDAKKALSEVDEQRETSPFPTTTKTTFPELVIKIGNSLLHNFEIKKFFLHKNYKKARSVYLDNCFQYRIHQHLLNAPINRRNDVISFLWHIKEVLLVFS